METIEIENDIKVMCVKAESFPDGIKGAWEKLHTITPPVGRAFYGLSRPENGEIIYMAASTEAEEGEAETTGLPCIIIRKGKYVCHTIENYMKDLPEIGRVFRTLLEHPGLDPEGYCVEWYHSMEDMKCLIRLAD